MTSTRTARTTRWLVPGTTVAALLSAGLVAACGGGGEAVASMLGDERAAARVRLEGCVVDQDGVPRTGSTVRALAADGRLIGDAASDAQGVFRFSAPARQTVTIALEGADGEGLVVPTGGTDLSVGACLLHGRD